MAADSELFYLDEILDDQAKEDMKLIDKKLECHAKALQAVESKASQNAVETSKKKKKTTKYFAFRGSKVVHSHAEAIELAENMNTTYQKETAAGNIAAFKDKVSCAPSHHPLHLPDHQPRLSRPTSCPPPSTSPSYRPLPRSS